MEKRYSAKAFFEEERLEALDVAFDYHYPSLVEGAENHYAEMGDTLNPMHKVIAMLRSYAIALKDRYND